MDDDKKLEVSDSVTCKFEGHPLPWTGVLIKIDPLDDNLPYLVDVDYSVSTAWVNRTEIISHRAKSI